MRDSITNSILYKCDEVNNTDFSNESFPDNSYYWVYDDYSSIDKSKILYGTYEVQKIIWKHQNPMICRDKKYIYVSDWPYGMGSQLITYGLLLSHIFTMNRIMLWNPKGKFPYFHNSSFCKGEQTFNCVFYPLSNCTPSENDDILVVGSSKLWPQIHKAVIPSFIHSILNKTSIDRSSYKWYWQAQSMTFIFRPLENIKKLLKTKAKGLSTNGNILDYVPASIYIRHGDKAREMKLIEDKYYVETFNNVADLMHFDKKMLILLVTQDPDSIKFFNNSNINFTFLDTLRSHEIKNGRFQFFENLLISLTEIWGMIRSDFFFTTRRSNFDQIRLALQQTVGFKTDALNFDVGQLRCLTAVHCKFLNTTLDFSVW